MGPIQQAFEDFSDDKADLEKRCYYAGAIAVLDLISSGIPLAEINRDIAEYVGVDLGEQPSQN